MRIVQTSDEKIEKERAKLEKLEASLIEEESALEKIQDSLKGLFFHQSYFSSFRWCYITKDKTQVFHDKIELKQKELAPWQAKINKTKAEIDIAVSEQDVLSQKAEAAQKAANDAELMLNQFKKERESKVA